MQNIIKNYLYSLSSIALIGSFLMASLPAYSVNILPVDTIIQQAYMRAAQGNDFNSLTTSLTK
ncbi:hypothetical protein KBC03_03420 [Patescibacteria group bacterium]|nr:hypothetical protein [Patescibacteria group bacterium]